MAYSYYANLAQDGTSEILYNLTVPSFHSKFTFPQHALLANFGDRLDAVKFVTNSGLTATAQALETSGTLSFGAFGQGAVECAAVEIHSPYAPSFRQVAFAGPAASELAIMEEQVRAIGGASQQQGIDLFDSASTSGGSPTLGLAISGLISSVYAVQSKIKDLDNPLVAYLGIQQIADLQRQNETSTSFALANPAMAQALYKLGSTDSQIMIGDLLVQKTSIAAVDNVVTGAVFVQKMAIGTAWLPRVLEVSTPDPTNRAFLKTAYMFVNSVIVKDDAICKVVSLG